MFMYDTGGNYYASTSMAWDHSVMYTYNEVPVVRDRHYKIRCEYCLNKQDANNDRCEFCGAPLPD